MTEIERPFLVARRFNTNLVQCVPPYFVIISNMHVRSLTRTIFHLHRRALKSVLHARKLMYEKNIIYEDLL